MLALKVTQYIPNSATSFQLKRDDELTHALLVHNSEGLIPASKYVASPIENFVTLRKSLAEKRAQLPSFKGTKTFTEAVTGDNTLAFVSLWSTSPYFTEDLALKTEIEGLQSLFQQTRQSLCSVFELTVVDTVFSVPDTFDLSRIDYVDVLDLLTSA